METATAAVGSVLTRLRAYLNNHKEDHCGDVEQLAQELERIHAALFCSASAHERAPPPGQQVHEEPTGACVGEARELAYDTDDAVDGLLLVTSSPPPVRQDSVGHTIEGLLQRATDLYRRIRPQVPGVSTVGAVAHPRKQQQQQHQVAPQPDGDDAATVVGVDDARDRLIRRLRPRGEAGDDEGDGKVKVVSVVGSPGLGKTTLAGEAYGAIRPRFDCAAFVSVGISPDVPQILEAALQQLGGVAEGADAAREPRDEGPLLIVSQLREFLQNKRYFIVLDDLWDTSTWEKIRGAFPDNNIGSRILTTIRNLDVADEIGATYELKPLSPEHSKKLFFRTAFGREEDKCPDDELTEVADKILEKCGGVPLAILTVGRLLASKAGDKGEWRRVCESMGSRPLENTPDVNNMRTAVFTGYYNLPPHLRACLLYTSIFPENYEIRRDRLIRRWIAEGFVQLQPGDERVESLYELGQSYFEELVNRSMIQFLDIDISDDGFRDEYCCSVSFPVMDFIRYLSSSQENFVAVLDGRQQCEFPTDMPVRRVCVRGQGGSKAEEDSVSLGTSMSKLRSLTVFSPATPGSVDLTNMSEFLRVLDLEGCDLSESRLLQDHLGRLVHLRYLGLRDTRIAAVPEEIGALKFLQTLDLEGNSKIDRLPESVARLGELACLRVSFQTLLPRGIGNMTALEELADATTRDSPGLVEALAGLTRLRVLRITLWQPAPREEEALVESLRCLRELQTLDVYLASGFEKRDDAARGDEDWWAPPPPPTRCLREFRAGAATSATLLSRARLLPSWLGATAVPPRLAVVVVHLRELRQRDVDALGRLPALRLLRLEPYDTAEALHVSGGGAFPRLEECRFRNGDVVPVFRPGAMPRLTRLEVCFRVRNTVDLGNAAFEFGFENLACLEEVVVYVGCQEAWETETDAAEAALRRAADGHPNRAAFEVITFGEELMCFDDDVN